MNKILKALLINPYIHDFKLYDEWMKPLGLYYIADYLMSNNIEVNYINCITRDNFLIKKEYKTKDRKYNTGNFHSIEIEKPEIYKNFIHRRYKQYGIPIEIFRKMLINIKNIDFIIVSSHMTYWYRGVFKTIKIIKEYFPKTPLFLGGIYSTLCYEHSVKFSGADFVIKGPFNNKILKRIINYINKNDNNIKNIEHPFPRYEIEQIIKYIPLLTAYGCPFNCSYCANKYINNNYKIENTYKIIKTIEYYYEKGIKNFIFYDDALLYNFKDNIYNIIKFVIEKNIKCNFHTPNAVHGKFITPYVAQLMKEAGFKTIRIGFETINSILQKNIGNKINNREIIEAINNLKKVGFSKKEIGIYIMIGMKNQTIENIVKSIDFIASLGVMVKPVTYSPIPHTKEFNDYLKKFPYIESEPLYQNDTFFIHHSNFISFEKLQELKNYIKRLNLST